MPKYATKRQSITKITNLDVFDSLAVARGIEPIKDTKKVNPFNPCVSIP